MARGANRGATEVATCVGKFLQNRAEHGVKDLVFYSYNCGGQNKKQFITIMYAKIVAATNIQTITHKFLEKGHTQNEDDAMHSTIEKAIGKTPVFTPLQYYVMVRGAKKTGKPYELHEMTTEEFLDYRDLAGRYMKNIRTDDEGNKVLWHSFRVMQLRKDSPNQLYYKTQYDEDFRCITYRKVEEKEGGQWLGSHCHHASIHRSSTNCREKVARFAPLMQSWCHPQSLPCFL